MNWSHRAFAHQPERADQAPGDLAQRDQFAVKCIQVAVFNGAKSAQTDEIAAQARVMRR